MKGDFTRFTHREHRHYAGVLMQQGRVTLDADWNEQFEIDDHRLRRQTVDTIGRACAPVDAPGFGIAPTPDGTDLVITPGRIYLDGILVEESDGTAVGAIVVDDRHLEVRDGAPDGRAFAAGQWVQIASTDRADILLTRLDDVDESTLIIETADDLGVFATDEQVSVRRVVTYLTQPYYPADAGAPLVDPFDPSDWDGRTHLVYLDVWRRHVTAVEDPYIREVALGGPDTATRVQTVWTVRILHADNEPVDASGLSCSDDIDAWDDLIEPSAGRLSARAEAAADPESPCAIEPDAGYRGLENRLYRVEVHEPGPRGIASFKWSRDNGSVLSSIVDWHTPTEIDVHSLGRDRVLRFSADNRVEVLSDDTGFASTTGTMASIVGAPDEADRRITLDQDVSAHEFERRPRVRRWDHAGAEPVTEPGWVELELGVQVRFGEGPFHVGDYWVIPARVAIGDVEGFVDAPPRGIAHHYARLGFVTWGADDPVLDCRHRFPPLCEIEPGDGDHCCTVSVGEGGDVDTLREAIDIARAIDGPVQICVLPGEHRLANTVVVDVGDLTITGCGRRSRLVAPGHSALLIDDVSDVRIENLVISSGSSEPTVAVRFSQWIEIIDCRISNRPRTERTPSDDLTAPTGNPRDFHLVPPTEVSGNPGEFAGRPFQTVETPDAFVFDPGVPRALGPAVGAVDVRGFGLRRCDLQGLPSVSVQGDEISIGHNRMFGGGVWLREGTEGADVHDNRITRGHTQGVMLGGLAEEENPRDDRSGLRSITIRGNHIAQMSREGVATALVDDDRIGEIVGLTIESNEIVECGVAPLVEQFALGGGILLLHASEVSIRSNRVVHNGPPRDSEARFKIGFGIACASSSLVDVSDNTVLDNGHPADSDREAFALNAGIVGLLVVGGAGETPLLLDGPAFRAHGNVIRVQDGPSIAVVASGPVSISDNHIVSRYPGTGGLDFGRAVFVLNLGAAPDLLSLGAQFTHAAAPSRPIHGRVQVHDNQVTAQSDFRGLPEPSDGNLNFTNLLVGSAIALLSFDDVALHDNQIVNEISVAGGPRIASSVWAMGSTLRTGSNRITEFVRTARFSYAGLGLSHHAVDNVTTHCIRTEGSNQVVEHNTELFCNRVQLADLPVHYLIGD